MAQHNQYASAKILIVDDQQANVLLITSMLAQDGYTVLHELTDAREVAQWCAVQQPDLILLDLHMPFLDGFAVLEQIQSQQGGGKPIPVLVLTADITLDARHRALALGANDFVTKPFDRLEVLLRVKNLLQAHYRLLQSHEESQVLAVRLRESEQERTRAHLEREQLTTEMQRQSGVDPLTKLPSRVLLHQRLTEAIGVARQDGSALALLVMDLDRFREVNENLNHQYGDVLLQLVAERLRGVVRETDTVARLGGDEFAVVLPGAKTASATWAARKILATFAKPFTIQGRELQASASIGLVQYPDHGADSLALLRAADVAMYAAKRAESGYAVYEQERDTHGVGRLTLTNDLRQAITRNQLTLAFQPKVHLQSGRAFGVEALVRWTHPQQGIIPPDRFVSLAEQTGLIKPLTLWVLQAALSQFHTWHQSGMELQMSVNLSMRLLHEYSLPATIASLLQRLSIAPTHLTLEVTESALGMEQRQTLDALTRLADLGVTIAIDDFGTGSSSLAGLSRLPVNELKIDRSFIQGMATSENDATIVRSVIDLGHQLGIQVVAEGVEHRTQWASLAEWGCDAIQGYYMSQPLDAADLRKWMLSSRYGISRVVT